MPVYGEQEVALQNWYRSVQPIRESVLDAEQPIMVLFSLPRGWQSEALNKGSEIGRRKVFRFIRAATVTSESVRCSSGIGSKLKIVRLFTRDARDLDCQNSNNVRKQLRKDIHKVIRPVSQVHKGSGGPEKVVREEAFSIRGGAKPISLHKRICRVL